jgi:hypothetical protein
VPALRGPPHPDSYDDGTDPTAGPAPRGGGTLDHSMEAYGGFADVAKTNALKTMLTRAWSPTIPGGCG